MGSREEAGVAVRTEEVEASSAIVGSRDEEAGVVVITEEFEANPMMTTEEAEAGDA